MTDKFEPLKTGTTLVVFKCKDGLVMGSEMRITAGSMVRGSNQKIKNLGGDVLIAESGAVSASDQITKILKAETKLSYLSNGRYLNARELASTAGRLAESSLHSKGQMGIVGFLLAGKIDDEFYCAEITPDGVIRDTPQYLSQGSGSLFVFPILDSEYKKDMGVKDGVNLLKKALTAAINRDTASGNGYLIYSITKDGIKEEVNEVLAPAAPNRE